MSARKEQSYDEVNKRLRSERWTTFSGFMFWFLLDISQWIVIGLCGIALLYYRNVYITLFLAGAIACNRLASILKKIIKQPRPDLHTKKRSHGMPSSHATSLGYFVSGLICFVYYLHFIDNPSPNQTQSSLTITQLLSFLTFSLSLLFFFFIMLFVRLVAGYHSVMQLFVGGLIGIVFGFLWNLSLFQLSSDLLHTSLSLQ